MNKNIWLVVVFVLLSLLGYFLFNNPVISPEIKHKKIPESAKVPPKAPIVKDIQLDHLIVRESPQENLKRELKKSKKSVEKRKSACIENSKELFNKVDFYKKDITGQINTVFEKTLNREESTQAFLKIKDLLYSDVPINLNIYYSLLFSLEICRSKESLNYLDGIIEYLNKDTENKEELGKLLIGKIKNNLLGNQYSPINLSLVFGKLSRLVNNKTIKEPFSKEIIDLKDHFLKYESEMNRNLKRAEGKEQLRDLTIEHFTELEEISNQLKSILDNI